MVHDSITEEVFGITRFFDKHFDLAILIVQERIKIRVLINVSLYI